MGTVTPWAAAGIAGMRWRGGVRNTIQPVSPCFHMQHDTRHVELVCCIKAYSFPSDRALVTTTNIPGPPGNCQDAFFLGSPSFQRNHHVRRGEVHPRPASPMGLYGRPRPPSSRSYQGIRPPSHPTSSSLTPTNIDGLFLVRPW